MVLKAALKLSPSEDKEKIYRVEVLTSDPNGYIRWIDGAAMSLHQCRSTASNNSSILQMWIDNIQLIDWVLDLQNHWRTYKQINQAYSISYLNLGAKCGWKDQV